MDSIRASADQGLWAFRVVPGQEERARKFLGDDRYFRQFRDSSGTFVTVARPSSDIRLVTEAQSLAWGIANEYYAYHDKLRFNGDNQGYSYGSVTPRNTEDRLAEDARAVAKEFFEQIAARDGHKVDVR